MYLKVQYNNSIKPYTLTNNYNKPYIKVSNSILPLTTNTTNGIHLNIQANNTTYRPLEYQSMSTSNTYYTSAVNSNGLSSTTALTRSSTYDTQYYTRSSTSSTVYYTRSSTSATNYLTQYDTKLIANSIRIVNHYDYDYNYSINRTTFSSIYYIPIIDDKVYVGSISGVYDGQMSSYNFSIGLGRNISLLRTIYTSYYNSNIQSSAYSTTTNNCEIMYLSVGRYYPTYATYICNLTNQCSPTNANNRTSVYIEYLGNCTSIWGNYNTRSINETRLTVYRPIITTGTQYLTRSSTSATSYLTRSSTYSTVYLTRSSISGYSGVSSSSSQSSGWL